MAARRAACVLIVAATVSTAQTPFPFLPGVEHDPAIPTLQQVLGFAFGDDVVTWEETGRYARALAEASPLVRLDGYGRSWERKDLHLLVVTSERNHRRLADVRAGTARLADPRRLADGDADRLLDELPATAWLMYTVHGNEASGTDAALALAYHLAAARGDALVERILDQCVVLIDPLQNPDGRDRFVHHLRQTRGPAADGEPDALEHDEPWPGGRTNHYWFDMNRDWFALTQPETQARVALFQRWWPQVVADVHEMNGNSTYYFAPPAVPINPEVTAEQRQWLQRFGRNNARWFDRFGFAYFVREGFDCFYPGYGEGWPLLNGAIGMTFEQASTRGLLLKREDDSELAYRDSVHHHFVASLATLETLADNRRDALAAFLAYRRTGTTEGGQGPLFEFVLPPGDDPVRTLQLAQLLARQGVEVHQAEGEIANPRTRDYHGGEERERTFPAGSFVVRVAQPNRRLAATLMVRHQDMDQQFLEEQWRKHERREGTDFYDLTGWSLPLLWDVECYEALAPSHGPLRLAGDLLGRGSPYPPPAPATVAYLLPWGRNAAAAATARLLREGVRARCAGKPFTQNGRTFPAGTVVVRVAENGDAAALHEKVCAAAAASFAEVVATDTSWVDDGVSFGSNRVRYLQPPRVAIACDRPVDSNSAGWARHLLEVKYGQPVTMVRAQRLARARLDHFNVVVLPDGSAYGDVLGKEGAEKLKVWIAGGGTLVALGDAVRWLVGEEVGLLAAKAEDRKPAGGAEDDKPAAADTGDQAKDEDEGGGQAEGEGGKARAYVYEEAIRPDKEQPAQTPGAVLRVDLDPEHWLGFGYPDHATQVVVSSRHVLTPIKLDKGTNVAIYKPREQLLASGFCWDDKLDQLARKPSVVHQAHGRGHVVAFTEDPNVRGFADGLDLMFLNAILFGPGM